MGGWGAWDAISRRADYFAAAVPICGGGDPTQANKLTNIPIWAWHGDQDGDLGRSGRSSWSILGSSGLDF